MHPRLALARSRRGSEWDPAEPEEVAYARPPRASATSGGGMSTPAPDHRRLFGGDPGGYDRARPDYPSRVYEILRARCGLRPGAATLEIGPGSGLATRRLLAL